jgi:hypothetical protein
MKNKIKAVFLSGFTVDIEQRIKHAKEFNSVMDARKFFKTKLLLNKNVFVKGIGYYKLIKI